MKFADIPGHDDVKDRLRRMADEHRLPHALLLEGPDGVAKFALARAYAQYIHCTDRHDGDSCGRCPSCLQHQSFNHADTFYSFPVIKKNSKPTISDDYAGDFHEFITENPYMDFGRWLSMLGNANAQPAIYVEEAAELLRRLGLTARGAEYKIVLMWLPERLREEAANKLLKLVEEPYPDTLFVMTSDAPAQILPTIYSRTQRIVVNRYTDSEIADELRRRMPIDPDAAAEIAARSDGSLTRAFSMASTDKNAARSLELFIELMRKAWSKDVRGLRNWSASIAELGREGMLHFYRYTARMVRDNFVINFSDPTITNLSAPEMAFSVKFARFINERNVIDMARTLDEAARDITLNANAKIVAFDLAVKFIILIRR